MRSKVRRQTQAGFTLVEVIVALTVVTIGILSTVVIANVTVTASNTNQKQVQAANLAREGVELVRNIRDGNWAIFQQNQAVPRAWDCYSETFSLPVPLCDHNMAATVSSDPTIGNFRVVPVLGNGSPYLQPHPSSGSGAAADTKDSFYLICPAASVQGTYTPDGAAIPCTGGGQSFYRRLRITQGKSPSSLHVQSYVSWPDKKAGDPAVDNAVFAEEYITDWRRIP